MSSENSPEDNKALVRRWFDEVWNKGRTDAIHELFDKEGIAHGLSDDPANPLRGPEGFLPFHAQFREAFPDIVVVVEDQIAEGDKVAARCTVRGKHAGDSLGFKATQAPVEFTGMTIVRIKDGKIVEAWNNFDFMKMYRQLGAI
jgi:steroid delta-isomerase-like uncharacterized protein